MVRAYARTTVFGYSFNFRDMLKLNTIRKTIQECYLKKIDGEYPTPIYEGFKN